MGTHPQTQPRTEFEPEYDPLTNLRIPLDKTGFRAPDGVWYHANGIRDEVKSPKQDMKGFYFNQP